MFGVLVGELDLDEDSQFFAEGLGCGVQAFGGFGGIEGVDGIENLRGFGSLIVLERANEVDLEAGRGRDEIGEGESLGLPFLNAIFAEQALPGLVGFKNGLGGMDFADGHEGDAGGGAVGTRADVGNVILEAFEI